MYIMHTYLAMVLVLGLEGEGFAMALTVTGSQVER